MDLRELEAATERRFRAVKRAVTAIYERATARFRCEPPATPPAWAAHPERLSSEAMEQIVLTEQRAHANGYYAGFVDAVRLIWRLARALGYAEGQRKLARDLAAANRAFLTEHARALAAAVDPTPRESTMERAARNRARLRKAGVIA
ncbi:hypothetical protein [Actinomyces ruminicola]|nr:hypothetical protein [Actinomyces ruminicola]